MLYQIFKKQKKFYEETLGIKITKEDEIVEEQKVKVSFVPCGDCEIELLESTTEDGPIAKYLAKKWWPFWYSAHCIKTLITLKKLSLK